MTAFWLLVAWMWGAAPDALPGPAGEPQADASAAVALFDRGMAFETFLARAAAQRDLWVARAATADVPPDLRDRLRHAATGLQFLVVAEDWCIDSANTLPYVARLAAEARVPMRVVDREAGRAVMEAHRTADGRVATPLVVLLRHDRDAGAWVERPVPLQDTFRAMTQSAGAARAFADRQTWYDRDSGRTALLEIVRLAEGTSVEPGRR